MCEVCGSSAGVANVWSQARAKRGVAPRDLASRECWRKVVANPDSELDKNLYSSLREGKETKTSRCTRNYFYGSCHDGFCCVQLILSVVLRACAWVDPGGSGGCRRPCRKRERVEPEVQSGRADVPATWKGTDKPHSLCSQAGLQGRTEKRKEKERKSVAS